MPSKERPMRVDPNTQESQRRFQNMMNEAGVEMNNEVVEINTTITPQEKKIMNQIEMLKGRLQRMTPQMPGYARLNAEIKRLNREVAGPLVNVGYLPKQTSYGGKRKTRSKKSHRRRRTCRR